MNTYEFVIKHPHKAAKKLQRLEDRVDEQQATIAKLTELLEVWYHGLATIPVIEETRQVLEVQK